MALLDDFIRANEDPLSDGGNWGAWTSGSQCKLDTNSATGRSGQNTRSAWTAATFGPDVIAEAGVDLPNSVSGASMLLGARITDVGTANHDGYALFILESGGGSWSVSILEFTNGSDSTIAGPTGISGDVDRMKLSCIGNTIKGYTHRVATGWTENLSVTNSAHPSAGNVGIGGFGVTWNFQEVLAGGPPVGDVSFDGILIA